MEDLPVCRFCASAGWAGGFRRVVVAIDPAVTSGEDADETGIICAAIDDGGHSRLNGLETAVADLRTALRQS
jgi:phage terminase large subunit-like protein